MLKSIWWLPLLIGGLFVVAFVSALYSFLFSSTDKSSVMTFMTVMAVFLLLVLTLPRIAEFSVGPTGATAKLNQLEEHMEQVDRYQQVIDQKVNEQQELLNQLVRYSMSASIFHHLCGIALLKEYRYTDNEPSRRELYFLRDHGFIRPKPPLDFLVFERNDGNNLVDMAEPTAIGWLCVRLRKQEIPQNMLNDPNRNNLRSDIDPEILSQT